MRIVSGTLKNRKILTPKGMITRPTSERLREALFNICQTYISDARFLDLFAGSGAMGLEALSRNAARTTFIDSSKESIKNIQQNISDLQLKDHSDVICGDVLLMVERLNQQKKQYDIIFADPPYDLGFGNKIVSLIDNSNLLAPGGMLFIEESVSEKLETVLKSLTFVSSRKMGRSQLYQFVRGTPSP